MGEYYGTPLRRTCKTTCPGSANGYWPPCNTSYGRNNATDAVAHERDITYCSRSTCPYQSRIASTRSRSAGPWSEDARSGLRLRTRPAADVRAQGGCRGVTTAERVPEVASRSAGGSHEDWELLVSEDSRDPPIYVRKSRGGVSDVKIEFDDGRGCRSRVRLHAPTSATRTTEDQSCGQSEIKSSEMFADSSEEALERNEFHSLRRRWSLWAVHQCSPQRKRSVTVTIDSCGTSATSLRGSQGSFSSESDNDEASYNPCHLSTVSIHWSAGLQSSSRGWEEAKSQTGRWQIAHASSEDEEDEKEGVRPRKVSWEGQRGYADKPPPISTHGRAEFESAETQLASKAGERTEEVEGVFFEADDAVCDAEPICKDVRAVSVTEEESWEDPNACVEDEVKSVEVIGRGLTGLLMSEKMAEAADDGDWTEECDQVTTMRASSVERMTECERISALNETPVAEKTSEADGASLCHRPSVTGNGQRDMPEVAEMPEGDDITATEGSDCHTVRVVAVFTFVLAVILFYVISSMICAIKSRGPRINPF
ncbi:uncharacterized protein LOC124155416 isoform X1 [Ischnura elegans]|uniref:uncharacterized protein LOC124155416 isoform X1 n=1 Tax=Ischnura elegans TaxID=197161 RepID=UPI001ED86976|nr:uncharacterized protein LOC124155416 isoform X1 [Ischnura elegans]